MATTITIRVQDDQRADLEHRAAQAGLDLSAFIRHALDIERDGPDYDERLHDHEQRLAALEAMAGL